MDEEERVVGVEVEEEVVVVWHAHSFSHSLSLSNPVPPLPGPGRLSPGAHRPLKMSMNMGLSQRPSTPGQKKVEDISRGWVGG